MQGPSPRKSDHHQGRLLRVVVRRHVDAVAYKLWLPTTGALWSSQVPIGKAFTVLGREALAAPSISFRFEARDLHPRKQTFIRGLQREERERESDHQPARPLAWISPQQPLCRPEAAEYAEAEQ